MKTWLAAALALAGCFPPAPEPPPVSRARSLAIAPPASGPGVEKLTLGLQPVFEPDRVKSMYGPLGHYLSEALGIEVTLWVPASYSETGAALRDGRVDLAQLGPLSFVVLENGKTPFVPLATVIAEGSTSYSGYLVAHERLHFDQLSDLRGRRFGLVTKQSASGYLYAIDFLERAGLSIEKDFSSVELLGNHDAVIDALLAGRIDAGATFSGALLSAERRGLSTKELRIIAKTGRIPNDSWVARSALPAAARQAVKAALLALSTRNATGRAVLSAIGDANGFAEFRSQDFEQIREVYAKHKDIADPRM